MSKNFDYIIIGGGLAGLQLALKFGKDRFFEQKTFAIIDPDSKDNNDKTWCFWEQERGEWDEIVSKTWKKGIFCSADKVLPLQLDPYSYKMLRSKDFYKYARTQLETSPNITFIKDRITHIDRAASVAHGDKFSYNTLHIFDSRIPEDYELDTKSTKIFQHFKGWMIETKDQEFDPSSFTMMDFRLQYNSTTSFTYILPVSPTKALIEYTFFSSSLVPDEIYEQQLERYIKDILKIKAYSIIETEKGVIPMTDYPFHAHNTSRITKIGTAGSWVKGSTGYSFKHTEKKVFQIIENIKKGYNPGQGLINQRARWYDAIFLDVLNKRNDLGPELFSKMYTKNTPQEIFKFLDEETSPSEEIKILLSLFHPQFLYSLFRKGFK